MYLCKNFYEKYAPRKTKNKQLVTAASKAYFMVIKFNVKIIE